MYFQIPTAPCIKCGEMTADVQSAYGITHMGCYQSMPHADSSVRDAAALKQWLYLADQLSIKIKKGIIK